LRSRRHYVKSIRSCLIKCICRVSDCRSSAMQYHASSFEFETPDETHLQFIVLLRASPRRRHVVIYASSKYISTITALHPASLPSLLYKTLPLAILLSGFRSYPQESLLRWSLRQDDKMVLPHRNTECNGSNGACPSDDRSVNQAQVSKISVVPAARKSGNTIKQHFTSSSSRSST